MSWLGDIFGATIGGLFGLAGAHAQQTLNFKDNKALQENQARLNYENSLKLTKEINQWTSQNMPSLNIAIVSRTIVTN